MEKLDLSTKMDVYFLYTYVALTKVFGLAPVDRRIGIKDTQLKTEIYKNKHNLPQYPQPKGRKTIIKVSHLQYVSSILHDQEKNVILFSSNILRLLRKNFEEFRQNPPPSLQTFKKRIRLSGYTWQKIKKIKIYLNSEEHLDLRMEVATNYIRC